MALLPNPTPVNPPAAMGNALGAGGVTGASAPQAPGAGQLSPSQFAAQQTAKAISSYQQYVNYAQTNMGRVDMNAINRQVGGELNAEVSPLLGGLNAQQKSGQQAINSFTSQFANQLSSISGNIQGAYGQAEQQQSALDTAIAASLRGAGTDQANALQQTLQSAGQNIAPAAQAAQAASGAAGASFASGSASLSQLISQGASNAAYGAKLSGYAALEGLQATQGLQASIANARSQILGDAQKQVPTLTNQLVNQQLTAEKDKGASLLAGAKVAGTNAKNANDYVVHLQDASTRAANAKISAAKAITAATKPTVYGGQKSGYFALVPDGNGGQTNVQLTTPGQPAPTIKTYANGLVESVDPTTGKLTIIKPATPKTVTPPNLTKVNGTQGGKLGTWLVNPKTGEKVSFTPNGKTPGSTGGQTTDSFATSARELTQSVTNMASGKGKYVTTHDANGTPNGQKWVQDANAQPVPLPNALSQAVLSGPDTPQWKQHAVQAVLSNPHYEVEAQQAISAMADHYVQSRVPYKKALSEIKATGTLIPIQLIVPILKQMYKTYGYGASLGITTVTPKDLTTPNG